MYTSGTYVSAAILTVLQRLTQRNRWDVDTPCDHLCRPHFLVAPGPPYLECGADLRFMFGGAAGSDRYIKRDRHQVYIHLIKIQFFKRRFGQTVGVAP